MAKPLEYNATLIDRRMITPQLGTFAVKPDDSGFVFIPGQYTVLGLKQGAPRLAGCDPEEEASSADPEKMIRRAYSISSGIDQPQRIEFYISLVTSGQLTPRFFNLEIGDRLYIGPSGRGLFTLEQVPAEKQVLLLATGTGLGPYISMVRSYLSEHHTRPLAVVHGARHSWDLGYRSELERLSREFPSFHYLPLVSRPQNEESWQGAVGRVQQWLPPQRLVDQIGFNYSATNTHVFLCGNPNMVTESIEWLQNQGFIEHSKKTPGNIHAEKWW